MPRTIAALSLAIWLVAGCFGAPEGSPEPGPATGDLSAAAGAPRPIIIDADLDHSDIAAILIMLRDPAVDVLGIAIDGTGLVHCQGGRLVLRYLLDEMGVPDIPFGCGREDGGPDATPFPEDWRAAADAGYGFDMTPRVEDGVPRDAVEILTTAIKDSRTPPLLVTLGPLTNIEDAFAADPTLADRVAGIHSMLGTLDAPGNVYVDGHGAGDPLEWNAFADPSAVEAVMATDVPITLIPLDATDDVPVPADLRERLAGSPLAAAADLMVELLARNPARMVAADGQQLWDELAALTVSEPGLVTWDDATVTVGADGRLTRDAAGRAVRFGHAADRAAVETALVSALQRGGPRLTPFAVVGEMTATWDGTTCAVDRPPNGSGIHTLRLGNTSGTPVSVTMVGLEPPHTWADVTTFLASVDLSNPETAQPPEWVHVSGTIDDMTGAGVETTAFVAIDEGSGGPVCATGTWPNLTFVAGSPFDIQGGSP